MSQIMKVPKGKSPEHGVVICRGKNYNLWKNPNEYETPYQVLSEGEAQIEGLKMKPGKMMPHAVDTLRQRILDKYDIDIQNEISTVGERDISLYVYLRDSTTRMPSSHPLYREPFDIEKWNGNNSKN